MDVFSDRAPGKGCGARSLVSLAETRLFPDLLVTAAGVYVPSLSLSPFFLTARFFFHRLTMKLGRGILGVWLRLRKDVSGL